MYKIRRKGKGVQVFDTYDYYKTFNLNQTEWEIVKAVKNYNLEKAIEKISSLFKISKKDAKEDIETVLSNINKIGADLENIPISLPRNKRNLLTVQFDVSSKCNSNCIYCLVSDHIETKEEVSTETILKVISELPDLGTWVLVLSGGEPLLRKDVFDIIEHADNLGILVQFLTNGILIDEKVAKRLATFKHLQIRISLDSCIPEHHDKHRGAKGSFEKTVRGIKNLKNQGITPEIAVVVSSINYDDFDKTVDFLKELGIKYVRIGAVSTLMGKGYEQREYLPLNSKQYNELGKKIIEHNKKCKSLLFDPIKELVVYATPPSFDKKLEPCGIGKSKIYISADGLVYPCIGVSFSKFVIGDIKKDKLSDIWKNSDLLKKLRNLTTKDIKHCSNCKFEELCTGGCRANSYRYFKSIFEHDPLYCVYYKYNK